MTGVKFTKSRKDKVEFIVSLVAGGLGVGITIVGVIAAISLVALASYLVSKGLEWLDERYKNKKKEWFE